MGGTWEVNIYCNDEKVTTLKIENSTTLSSIRYKCGDSIPKNDNYKFISRNNFILTDENSYTAKDVYKEDGKSYRIDLKTKEFLENKDILLELTLNDHNPIALYANHNASLNSIKSSAFKDKPQDSLVFITKDKSLIENENISQFKLKDVIKYENGKRKIQLYEKDYYHRVQVIDHLRKLEEQTKNGKSIDWFKENEFFKKIDKLAGSAISKAIQDDLKEETPGNGQENKRKSDQEYIQLYLKCLLNEGDSSSAPVSKY